MAQAPPLTNQSALLPADRYYTVDSPEVRGTPQAIFMYAGGLRGGTIIPRAAIAGGINVAHDPHAAGEVECSFSKHTRDGEPPTPEVTMLLQQGLITPRDSDRIAQQTAHIREPKARAFASIRLLQELCESKQQQQKHAASAFPVDDESPEPPSAKRKSAVIANPRDALRSSSYPAAPRREVAEDYARPLVEVEMHPPRPMRGQFVGRFADVVLQLDEAGEGLLILVSCQATREGVAFFPQPLDDDALNEIQTLFDAGRLTPEDVEDRTQWGVIVRHPGKPDVACVCVPTNIRFTRNAEEYCILHVCKSRSLDEGVPQAGQTRQS